MIERPDVPRSRFTGSWTRKTTFDAGRLIPFLVEEVLPGDHLKYNITAYVRMSTPLFPMFDSQRIDTHLFFVPNRLVWQNWVGFMGEQSDPSNWTSYLIPQVVSPAAGWAANTIYDHMGIPVASQITAGQTISVNALPLRAYNLIFNEWFRDQNMQNKAIVQLGDGPENNPVYYGILRRAKSHDYFTSALPFPQKSIVNPTVPLTGQAPVSGIGILNQAGNFGASNVTVREYLNPSVLYTFAQQTADATRIYVRGDATGTGANPVIYADMSATSVGLAINSFRQSMALQSLLERDARGGTRYVEVIKAHFGVTSPDARLQRPEYIGGGSTPLNLTPVAQTAPTAGVPVGALGAAGTGVGMHSASYASTEHGFIIGLISIKSELSYQQGLNRMWSRQTRYDYYWPSFAQLGEQAIKRQEIYCTGVDADDNIVFGYQERWHEYRTRTSEVTGQFRSTAAGTLDPWHLGQRFTGGPVLDQNFIIDDPPMSRVLAAGVLAANQQYLADILIQRDATRPLPMYSTPSNLGRF
nr:MAG: major capsid protein [Microvirus sp.]